VIDVRNFGLMAGIELEPLPGSPGARGYQAFLKCLENGLLIRVTGDTIALSPPLIISPAQLEELGATLDSVLRATA
jgi:beta-alanine--pyruvate transaminase